MPKWAKTQSFRWISGVLATTLTLACTGAWWSSGMNTWRESVTEDLGKVEVKVDRLSDDMSTVKEGIRWIRDDRHKHSKGE